MSQQHQSSAEQQTETTQPDDQSLGSTFAKMNQKSSLDSTRGSVISAPINSDGHSIRGALPLQPDSAWNRIISAVVSTSRSTEYANNTANMSISERRGLLVDAMTSLHVDDQMRMYHSLTAQNMMSFEHIQDRRQAVRLEIENISNWRRENAVWMRDNTLELQDVINSLSVEVLTRPDVQRDLLSLNHLIQLHNLSQLTPLGGSLTAAPVKEATKPLPKPRGRPPNVPREECQAFDEAVSCSKYLEMERSTQNSKDIELQAPLINPFSVCQPSVKMTRQLNYTKHVPSNNEANCSWDEAYRATKGVLLRRPWVHDSAYQTWLFSVGQKIRGHDVRMKANLVKEDSKDDVEMVQKSKTKRPNFRVDGSSSDIESTSDLEESDSEASMMDSYDTSVSDEEEVDSSKKGTHRVKPVFTAEQLEEQQKDRERHKVLLWYRQELKSIRQGHQLQETVIQTKDVEHEPLTASLPSRSDLCHSEPTGIVKTTPTGPERIPPPLLIEAPGRRNDIIDTSLMVASDDDATEVTIQLSSTTSTPTSSLSMEAESTAAVPTFATHQSNQIEVETTPASTRAILTPNTDISTEATDVASTAKLPITVSSIDGASSPTHVAEVPVTKQKKDEGDNDDCIIISSDSNSPTDSESILNEMVTGVNDYKSSRPQRKRKLVLQQPPPSKKKRLSLRRSSGILGDTLDNYI